MRAITFQELYVWLYNNTPLKPLRNLLIDKKVVIFVWTLAHGASNRVAQERWDHSGKTVS